jgi:UrcA family protein
MYLKPEAIMLLDIPRYGAVLASLLLAPALSPAADLGETPTMRVHIGDLNLTSPSGRNVMTVRVSKAAELLCQKPVHNRELASHVRFRTCHRLAMASAEPQMRQAIDAATPGRVDITLNLDNQP